MTVKSVRCGGRGVSHCSPALHLHCWWAQRSCTVVSVCKCNYALCEVFWLWALWQCDMHLMLPVSGQDTKPRTYHVMMAPDRMVQNQSLPQLHGYRYILGQIYPKTFVLCTTPDNPCIAFAADFYIKCRIYDSILKSLFLIFFIFFPYFIFHISKYL